MQTRTGVEYSSLLLFVEFHTDDVMLCQKKDLWYDTCVTSSRPLDASWKGKGLVAFCLWDAVVVEVVEKYRRVCESESESGAEFQESPSAVCEWRRCIAV